MIEHSKVAWDIASRYSDILASETRDLAAAIDVAIANKVEDIRRSGEPCGVCGCAVYKALPMVSK
jgi:hypothetical protein